jgi:hypothetical protein
MVNCVFIYLGFCKIASAAISKTLGRICYHIFESTYNCKRIFYLMQSSKSDLRVRLLSAHSDVNIYTKYWKTSNQWYNWVIIKVFVFTMTWYFLVFSAQRNTLISNSVLQKNVFYIFLTDYRGYALEHKKTTMVCNVSLWDFIQPTFCFTICTKKKHYEKLHIAWRTITIPAPFPHHN